MSPYRETGSAWEQVTRTLMQSPCWQWASAEPTPMVPETLPRLTPPEFAVKSLPLHLLHLFHLLRYPRSVR